MHSHACVNNPTIHCFCQPGQCGNQLYGHQQHAVSIPLTGKACRFNSLVLCSCLPGQACLRHGSQTQTIPTTSFPVAQPSAPSDLSLPQRLRQEARYNYGNSTFTEAADELEKLEAANTKITATLVKVLSVRMQKYGDDDTLKELIDLLKKSQEPKQSPNEIGVIDAYTAQIAQLQTAKELAFQQAQYSKAAQLSAAQHQLQQAAAQGFHAPNPLISNTNTAPSASGTAQSPNSGNFTQISNAVWKGLFGR